MRLAINILFTLFMCTKVAYADSPAPQYPKVTSSPSGSYYFKMIPTNYRYVESQYEVDSKPFGKAFRINHNGDSEEMWSVSGWYAFSVFLSDDGKYLVRLGNWSEGHEPSKEDLAVAFYHLGTQIKSYSTKDLIDDKSKVKRSISHYIWLEEDDQLPELGWGSERFKLKTVEGKIFHFDITTGEIVRTELSRD